MHSSILARVVARVTSHNDSPVRPWERSTRNAYIDWAACLSTLSMWTLNERWGWGQDTELFYKWTCWREILSLRFYYKYKHHCDSGSLDCLLPDLTLLTGAAMFKDTKSISLVGVHLCVSVAGLLPMSAGKASNYIVVHTKVRVRVRTSIYACASLLCALVCMGLWTWTNACVECWRLRICVCTWCRQIYYMVLVRMCARVRCPQLSTQARMGCCVIRRKLESDTIPLGSDRLGTSLLQPAATWFRVGFQLARLFDESVRWENFLKRFFLVFFAQYRNSWS